MKRLFLSILLCVLMASTVFAQKQFVGKSISKKQVSPYFTIENIQVGSVYLDRNIISGPSRPPAGIERLILSSATSNQIPTIVSLSDVPAFNYCFGCVPTSGAMIAGYYDRHGYDNIYAGPTNGGIMPLTNSAWPTWLDAHGDTYGQCPLSATHDGLDGRVGKGHIDDYWVQYNSAANDPYVTNGWTQHTYGECTADFMKSNQSSCSNVDGSTTIYNYTNGSPLPASDIESYGISGIDGGYGFKLFYESRGYTVVSMFNQYIYGTNGNTIGFTYAQFKTEINAGHPVLLHLEGHTVAGIGYNMADSTIYIHDTWDYSTHSMIWGSTYAGMKHVSVTVVHLAEPEIDLLGNGSSIPNGDSTPSVSDSTEFGTVRIGDSMTHTFIIHNGGSFALKLTDTIFVRISGSADFSIVSQPVTSSVAPDSSISFTVQYAPSILGIQTAILTIANTDLTESSYQFTIQGTGESNTSVELAANAKPDKFSLGQNYPNPFNPSTTIYFSLPVRSMVRLEIFNVLGQHVSTVLSGIHAAGFEQVIWQANVPSGIYFYRLEAISTENPEQRFVDVKKMLFIK